MKAPVLAILFGAIWLPLQAAQAVDMQYGWKPGMSCKVQHSVKTLKGKESKVSFVLKTSPGPNGLLLVEVADMKSLDPKVPLSADPAKVSAFYEQLFGWKIGAGGQYEYRGAEQRGISDGGDSDTEFLCFDRYRDRALLEHGAQRRAECGHHRLERFAQAIVPVGGERWRSLR